VNSTTTAIDTSHPLCSVLNGLSEAILILDGDLKVVWSNRILLNLLGFTETEIRGADAAELFAANLAPSALMKDSCAGIIPALLAGRKEMHRFEGLIRTARGEDRWFSGMIRQLDGNGNGCAWVLRLSDITDQKLSEKRLERTAGRLGGQVRDYSTLYSISRMIETDSVPLDRILAGTAKVLPSGFQHPERLDARIILGENEYTSEQYTATAWRISSPIVVQGVQEGTIEVTCRDELRNHPLPAFISNEQDLLQAVAEMLGREIARRRTEEASRRQAELLDLTHDTVIVLDMHGRITFWNRGAQEQYGWSETEALGKEAHTLLCTRSLQSLSEIREEVLSGGRWEGELVQVRKDGALVSVASRWALQRGEDGKPTAILETNHDITARKRVEEALLRKNRHLSALNQIIAVSASPGQLDGFLQSALDKTLELLECELGMAYLSDPDGQYPRLMYHRGVRELPGGWKSDYLLPESLRFIGLPRYIEHSPVMAAAEEELLKALSAASLACIPLVAGQEVFGVLCIGKRNDPPFSAEDKCLIEAIAQEIGFGMLRWMLQQRLEASNREANLYLDIITHDIKNVANVSGLYLDLLIGLLEGEAAEYARRLRASNNKGIEILSNVSTIRKIYQQNAVLEPIDLAAVIREGIRGAPDAVIHHEGAPHTVLADRLLSEVFSNLIGNAVKFGGPGVHIFIRTERQEDGTVLVAVEDTGPGIPDIAKKAIFRRFGQGKRQGSGDGLGLYIVRTLVERYGGRVWVEDRVPGRPDEGAAFRFTLRSATP